jgi:hypothetical protein
VSLALQWLVANALAAGLLVGGLVDDQTAFDTDEPEQFARYVALGLGGYLALLIAWRWWRRSRQYVAASATEAMALDPRPPVLYLRSFLDDGRSLLAQTGAAPKRALMAFVQLRTPEEDAADALHRIGPVIAIGKPGEPLPELGAARMYVPHDRWKAEVLALMQRAALVVIRLGSSPGVLWEIDQTLAQVPKRRIVFMRLGREPVAAEIAARLSALLPARLLDAPESGVGRLIYFDRIETPVAVEIGAERRRSGDRWSRWLGLLVPWLRWLRRPMRSAWQEVRAGVGLAGSGRRESNRAVAVGLALWLGMFGAHWFYLGRPRRGVVYLLALPLLLAPMFVSWADAVRFLWVDRSEFQARHGFEGVH